VIDSLLAGPAFGDAYPATSGIHVASYFSGPVNAANAIATIVTFLRDFVGVDVNFDDDDLPSGFLRLLEAAPLPSYYIWDSSTGWEPFWANLAASLSNVEVRLDSPVQAVRPSRGKRESEAKKGPTKKRRASVVVDGKKACFDAVVVTTPPAQTAALLSFLKEGKGKDDYSKIAAFRAALGEVPARHASVVVAARVAGFETAGLGKIGGIALDNPVVVDDYALGAIAKLYEDSDVVLGGFYLIDEDCDDADLDAVVHRSVADANAKLAQASGNVTLTEVLVYECFSGWPYRADVDQVDDGFFDTANAAQGQGDLFFLGEVLTGASIPAVLAYAEDNIPSWFPDLLPK